MIRNNLEREKLDKQTEKKTASQLIHHNTFDTFRTFCFSLKVGSNGKSKAVIGIRENKKQKIHFNKYFEFVKLIETRERCSSPLWLSESYKKGFYITICCVCCAFVADFHNSIFRVEYILRRTKKKKNEYIIGFVF